MAATRQKDAAVDWQRQETERADQSLRDPEELLGEVSKVLQVRRWEAPQGPFRGFGSPPGRF